LRDKNRKLLLRDIAPHLHSHFNVAFTTARFYISDVSVSLSLPPTWILLCFPYTHRLALLYFSLSTPRPAYPRIKFPISCRRWANPGVAQEMEKRELLHPPPHETLRNLSLFFNIDQLPCQRFPSFSFLRPFPRHDSSNSKVRRWRVVDDGVREARGSLQNLHANYFRGFYHRIIEIDCIRYISSRS
jgi:hypothetical protein